MSIEQIGKLFTGWKTCVGAAMVAGATIAQLMGKLDPGTAGLIRDQGYSLMGIGLAHKLQRLLKDVKKVLNAAS